ncbi:hypothetical protein SAMN06269185_3346 [Natronoarchaeum philippinense]|uniref:Uncharacterized protein n=1 Tax=Natronoarchaeum philippinense TaxID=558529 RepID=A0A285P9F7_NATPI|nr:hypothetical protein [Natronoarchaeum philippinense]SNZ18362.1 hypothetical protein SAMN06269185_3346 [Natronoarchaeum philippinense]
MADSTMESTAPFPARVHSYLMGLSNETDSPPVASISSIAKEFDVSGQTVRNHLDAVLSYDGVRTTEIGNAMVLWYSVSAAADDGSIPLGDLSKQERQELTLEVTAEKRGAWLWKRSRREKLLRSADDDTIVRTNYMKYTKDYLRNFATGLTDWEEGTPSLSEWMGVIGNARIRSPPSWLDIDQLEYLALEAPLFESEFYGDFCEERNLDIAGPTNEVTGLAQFQDLYTRAVRQEFENDGTLEFDNISRERRDEILLSVSELSRVDELADDFVCEYLNWE